MKAVASCMKAVASHMKAVASHMKAAASHIKAVASCCVRLLHIATFWEHMAHTWGIWPTHGAYAYHVDTI